MKYLVAAALLCASLHVSASAQDQGGVVNFNSGSRPAQGSYLVRAGVRAFGDEEDQAYGELAVEYGISPDLAFLARTSFGKVKTFSSPGLFIVRHGGTDVEFAMRWNLRAMPELSLSAGASFPNTPQQNTPFATLQATYAFNLPEDRVQLFLNSRGVFGTRDSLLGLGGGFSFAVGEGIWIVGDATAILSGNNTFKLNTGQPDGEWLFGVGVRFQRDRFGFEAGATNALGNTTGFSLSPALGQTLGFYVAVSTRY